MYVSLCSYCTIRMLISNTLTGIYEGCCMYVFEMCFYRTWDIVLYILLLITKYVHSVTTLQTLKIYAVLLRLVSDIFPVLILYY